MPLALTAVGLFLLTTPWFGVPSWRLVAPYALGAVASGLTIGKVGSNVNYLIELGAGVSLAIGALLAWQRPPPGSPRRDRAAARAGGPASA